jgi:hypothetical protein
MHMPLTALNNGACDILVESTDSDFIAILLGNMGLFQRLCPPMRLFYGHGKKGRFLDLNAIDKGLD